MKKQYIFESEMLIPESRDRVFEFFRDAENLQKLTPPWLDFKILTPIPIDIREGQIIDYRLKLWGLPFSWKTEISQWQPPHKFQDIQITGPYKLWVHTHTFEEVEDGTLMRDQVRYLPRGSILAPWINRLFVARNIRMIFKYREKSIMRYFKTTLPA
jgi:ligand-binding SRPBCC domain-containing protein